jgi:hypothetical protein
LRQNIEQTSSSETKLEMEIFSAGERRIAKLGLLAAIPMTAILVLWRIFPNNPQIEVMFAYLGALMLITAFVSILVRPAEITAKAVKKLADRSLMCLGRSSANLRALKRLFLYDSCGQRHIYLARMNARAHRTASRNTLSSKSHNSSDDGESDQGDPPGSSRQLPATPSTHSNQKLNSSPVLRRSQCSPCCWPVPAKRHESRGCVA